MKIRPRKSRNTDCLGVSIVVVIRKTLSIRLKLTAESRAH
jgi:hypothetical protein